MIAQYLMVDNDLLEQLQNATDTARTALLESKVSSLKRNW